MGAIVREAWPINPPLILAPDANWLALTLTLALALALTLTLALALALTTSRIARVALGEVTRSLAPAPAPRV